MARPATDERDPLARLARLLDPGSLTLLHRRDEVAVAAVRGRIGGEPIVAFSTDATRQGGALSVAASDRIADAIDLAAAGGRPVVGLWHSGGARLADGVESLHGIGRVFAATVRASGRVPQLSVVLGAAAGGAAYGPALTDIVVMAPAGSIFVTGPDVVRKVTGEQIDLAGLGGAGVHGARSGVAHVTADSEEHAYERCRRLIHLLGRPGAFDPASVSAPIDLRALLPDSARRAYDVRPLVRALLDADSLEELHAKWAPNIVVGLGRLAGGTVGVVANNPLRKAGCLDSLSAEKAARFVRMCDALGVPLLVVVDVPGYLPGVGQEWGGVVRRGAKLLYAFAEARVPRVTLITRKAYGGAYIAMNSRALGATAVYAWPEAEVAVMSADAAVEILHRRTLAAAGDGEREALRAALAEEHRVAAGGLDRGLALGVVDGVIAPAESRRVLAAAFAAAGMPERPGAHGNIPL